MNENAGRSQGNWTKMGLRLCSLAVAGIVLGVVQGPISPAVAADDIGADIQIVQHTEDPWSAGTPWFLDELVNYQDVDLPLNVTVDWGDGDAVSGTFDGSAFVSKDDLMSMYPTWDVDPVVPGDNVMNLFARHTYAHPATYPVTITVVDGQGTRVQATQSLEVTGSATPADPAAGPVPQEVSFAKLRDRVYGDDFYIDATGGDSGNPVTITTSTPDVCRAEGPNGMRIHLLNVGTCLVDADQAGGAGYLEGSWYDGFAVEPAPLRIVAQDQQKASYEPDPAWTVEYDGLVNGDTPSVVSGLRVEVWDRGSHGPVAPREPGRYVLRPSGASARNYEVTFGDGTLTVDPAVRVSVTGLSDDLRDKAVKVNGQRVGVPYLGSVAFGSDLTVDLAQVALDVPSAELYITTVGGLRSAALRRDVQVQAGYRTIPGLVDGAVLPGYATVARMLKNRWDEARRALLVGSGGLERLQNLADRVRVGSGLYLDPARATVLVNHLQVVYSAYGGRGQV